MRFLVVYLAGKWYHMMLTQREYLYIFDNYQFIMVLMEDSSIDKITDVLLIPFGEEEHSFGISLRRTPQAFSLRILSDAL